MIAVSREGQKTYLPFRNPPRCTLQFRTPSLIPIANNTKTMLIRKRTVTAAYQVFGAPSVDGEDATEANSKR